jgi:uncharacterized C2H2 Zn-finger protein
MIKIIKKGEPLNDSKSEVYETTCPSCNTVFEFTLKECAVEKRLDGNLMVNCPVCGFLITRNRTALTAKYTINKEDD